MEISINNLVQGINAKAHRKVNNYTGGLKLISFDTDKKQFVETLDVRFYSTNAMTYCCVWGSIKGEYFNGSGNAGGYGYDKESAAFSNALQSAGFNVSCLYATGQNELAVERIAQLSGLENYTIVRVHA